jgi:hypothetical protein
MRRLLAVLALGAVVVACSEQATSPQSTTPAGAPTFDISNAPPQSGIVLREGRPIFILWGFPSEGFEVAIGVDAREFCAGWPDPWGAEFSVVTWADKQLVDRLMTHMQGRDVTTGVWPYGYRDPAIFCAQINGGAAPFATGVTRVSLFSSDWYGTGDQRWVDMIKSHGILTRPDGSRAVFNFQMQMRQWEFTKVTASLK